MHMYIYMYMCIIHCIMYGNRPPLQYVTLVNSVCLLCMLVCVCGWGDKLLHCTCTCISNMVYSLSSRIMLQILAGSGCYSSLSTSKRA